MPVRDIARGKEELVIATPDTPLSDLARQMRDSTVGSVIIESDGDIQGILTDRDLALKVVGEGMDPSTLTAEDVMLTDVATVDVDDGVFDVCRVMRENTVRRVPVLEDGELCGIVALDDLLVLIEDELHDLSAVIKAESPPYPAP
jgi:signal-transduction protein with cAMP-binding, CBS, and nucleotidyltransferase domain